MAEETVDALVLTTEFDEAGLDAAGQQQLDAIRAHIQAINKAGTGIEPIEAGRIVGDIAARLKAIGADTSVFFDAMQQEIDSGVADWLTYARAVGQVKPPDVAIPVSTDPAQVAVITGLTQAQRELAQQTGATAQATQGLVAEEERLTGALSEQAQASAAASRTQAQNAENARRAQAELAKTSTLAREVGQQAIPPLDVDVRPIIRKLQEAGTDVEAFFRNLRAGAADAVETWRQLTATMGQVRVPELAVPTSDPAQLRLLNALLEEEAALEKQVTETADATRRLSAEETTLAASQAQAAIAAVKAGAAHEAQAQAALRATQTAAQAMRLAAAVEQTRVAPHVTVDPNIGRLAAGYMEATRASNELRASQVGLNRGVSQVAATMGRATSGANAWAAGLRQAETQQKAAGAATQGAVAGTGKLANALVGLTSTMLDVPPAVSNITSTLLTMGVGGTVGLAVIAGITAIAAAWTFLNREALAAAEEQKRAIDLLHQRAETTRPVTAAEQERAARARLLTLQQEILRIEAAIEAAREAGLGILTNRYSLEQKIAEQQQVQLDLIEVAKQAVNELLRARQNAAKQATDDELDFARQALQGEQSLLEGALQLQLITRQQFLAKQFALTERLAAAEIAVLEAQREKLAVIPAKEDPAAKVLREAEIRHLTAQIALREDSLRIAREQLGVAQEIAKVEQLRKAGIGEQVAPTGLAAVVTLKPVIDTTELLATMQRELGVTGKAILDNLFDQATKDAIALAEVMRGMTISLKELGDANITKPFADARTEAEKMQATMQGVAGIFGALAGVGANLGLSEAADKMLQAAEGIGQAFASFLAGDPLGAIAGLIGTIGGLLGGGESEHDRIVRENTDRIAENTAARRQETEVTGLGQATAFARGVDQALTESNAAFLEAMAARQKAIDALVQQGVAREVAELSVQRGPSEGMLLTAELNKQLDALGLTMADVRAQAEKYGIQVFDENGNLVIDALQQLATEMQLAAEAAFKFHEGLFADQARLAGLRSRAKGVEQDPMELFRQQIEAAGAVGAEVIDKFFGSIDKADPDALRKATEQMIEAWRSGAIDLEDLGGLTQEQFLALADSALNSADALEQLAESTRRTLAQQESNLELQARLAGKETDPSAVFGRQITALADFNQAFALKLRGLLGAGDIEGIRAALLAQFDQLAQGIVPPGLTADEWNAFLEQGATFLDSFNTEVETASKSLQELNVPQGFRRAALAFEAGVRGQDVPVEVTVQAPPEATVAVEAPETVNALENLVAAAQVTPADLLTSVAETNRSLAALIDVTTAAAVATGGDQFAAALQGLTDATREAAQPQVDPVATLLPQLVQLLAQTTAATAAAGVGGPTVEGGLNITINVNGAPASPAVRQDITDAVITAMRRIGMAQSGNTLQFPVL